MELLINIYIISATLSSDLFYRFKQKITLSQVEKSSVRTNAYVYRHHFDLFYMRSGPGPEVIKLFPCSTQLSNKL